MLRIKSTIYLTGQVNNNDQNYKFKTNQNIFSFVVCNFIVFEFGIYLLFGICFFE